MKSYLERLEEYKKVEQTFKMAEKVLREEKENFEEYVKQNIVLRDYTVKEIQLKYGYKLYYPVLNIPEGFTIKSEKYTCEYPEEIFEDSDYLNVIREYVLADKKTDLEVQVYEKSPRLEVTYRSKGGIRLKIKDKILVVPWIVEYHIKINDMKFHFERDFEGKIMNKLLTDILKDKYICYRDFKKTKTFGRTRLTKRFCDNHLLDLKPDWKNNIKNYVEEFSGYADVDKVISDIEEVIKKGKFESRIEKYYYFKREYTLAVFLQIKYNTDKCIFYEDEHLLLEIPSPIRKITLGIGQIKQPYKEGEQPELEKQYIEEQDIFTIRLDNLDMDNPMKLLDILKNY